MATAKGGEREIGCVFDEMSDLVEPIGRRYLGQENERSLHCSS